MWDLREYLFASSPREAVALCRHHPGRGRYIAGGTDLYLAPPRNCDFVVDINGAGLNTIVRTRDGDLFLGAAATLHEIANSPLVATFAGGAIAAAAHHCGNRPVRSVATVGGNLCNASPAADMAPILLALDGRAHITDEQDLETVPLQDFFQGPRQTVLGDRLLVGVSLPQERSGAAAAAHKLTRTAEDISLVQAAVSITLTGNVIQAAGVALGAVAPVPLRAAAAEAALIGVDISTPAAIAAVAQAAEQAAAACQPIDDHRAGAEYRRAMVEVLTRRLCTELLARPQGGAA